MSSSSSRRRSSRARLPMQSSPIDPDAMMRDIDQEAENGSASGTHSTGISQPSPTPSMSMSLPIASSSKVGNRKRKFSPPRTETSSHQQQAVSDSTHAAAASSEVAVGSSSSWLKRTRAGTKDQWQLAASPFLRFLHRDVDAVSVMMQFLSLNGVRDLYSTCRMWKDFITSNPRRTSFPGNSRMIIVNKDLHQLWGTQWLGSQLLSLFILSDYDLRQCGIDDFESLYEPLSLNKLPQFTRLTYLHVASEETNVAPQDIEFMAQLSSLQTLSLSFPMEAITQRALERFSGLSNLKTLHIDCRQLDHSEQEMTRDRRLARKLRFKCLQNLTQLEDFSFTPCLRHFCTKDQMLDIARMKKLKTFKCGNLLPTHWDRHEPTFDGGRSYAQFIEETYGVLPQMPSLEVLNLENVTMESQILAHVTKCASLRRLSVNNCNLACQDEWISLKHLHNLREFEYKGTSKSDDTEFDSIPASVFTGLAQCPFIEKLSFSNVKLPEMMLTQLVNQAPNLQTFCLSECSVPSLKPLANAPALKRLEIRNISNPLPYTLQLPTLPHLTSLQIRGYIKLDGPKKVSDKVFLKLISKFKAELVSRMPNLSVDAINHDYVSWLIKA